MDTQSVLNAVFNFCNRRFKRADGSPLWAQVPTVALSKERAWYKIPTRTDYIDKTSLPAFYKELCKEDTATFYAVMISLLTGSRKEEVCGMRWDEVDIPNKMLHISGSRTKNKKQHDIPISDYCTQMFKQIRVFTPAESSFVFPHKKDLNRSWCISPPRLPNIGKRLGIANLKMHSVRRTFSTHGYAIAPFFHVEKFMNHTSRGVTAQHYIVLSPDALRSSVELIDAWLLREMKAVPEFVPAAQPDMVARELMSPAYLPATTIGSTGGG